MNIVKCVNQSISLLILDKGRVLLLCTLLGLVNYFFVDAFISPVKITVYLLFNLLISAAITRRLFSIKIGKEEDLFTCFEISFKVVPKIIISYLLVILVSSIFCFVVMSILLLFKSTIYNESFKMLVFYSLAFIYYMIFIVLYFLQVIIVTHKNVSPLQGLYDSLDTLKNSPKKVYFWIIFISIFPKMILFLFIKYSIILFVITDILLYMFCASFALILYQQVIVHRSIQLEKISKGVF